MRQSHCSRHEQLVRLSLLVALATYAALTLPAAAQTQTVVPPLVTTDATDYSAGDDVFIAGDHWNPGEFVMLQIREDGNPGHVDTLHVTADAAGGVTAEYVVPGHGITQTFTLTATGASTGAQASAVFSNAYYPAPFSWDTADWATAAPSSTPWIRTNRDDYQPGDFALFAGGGWFPGDLVTINLAKTGSDHVHPSVQLHAVADETGLISAAYVLQPHDLGESYELIAASAADPTMLARTTFSDSGFNFHTCALTTNGGARCWGANGSGQLGDGTTLQRLSQVGISGLSSGGVLISTGAEHTCSLTIGGGVKCWGRNSDGELGDGTTTQQNTPVDVSGLTSGVIHIGAGMHHTCAVTSGGGVKCWGWNGFGQLGNGTSSSSSTPVSVFGLASGIAQVRAGGFHSCALTTAGGVKCWGWNLAGQLGNGTTSTSLVPVDVSGLAIGVVQISTGGDHTCAVTTGGGVKCWGQNTNGQLGDGTTTNQTTPVDVNGLTSGVVQVATGSFHTCALTTAGGVKCWGFNGANRLGDGTSVTQRLLPANVIGLLSGAAQVYAGSEHTCALTTTGGMKCWGYNGFGSVGDGTNVNRPTQVNVSGLTTGVIAVPEITATTYTLSYLAGAHGTINGVAAQVVYAGQSGTAVTAVPDAGYHFVAWSDGLLSATRTDSNVVASVTMTASFAPNSHALTYTAEAHGAISGTSPQTVNDGADGTPVTAAPDTGYHFVTWSDGVLTATRTDMHVTADIAVTASFAINTYVLTYTAGPHGTVSGTSPQAVDHFSDGSPVTALADTGYRFVEWSDGSTANPRSELGVTGPTTVVAGFAVNQYTVTYAAGPHGSISGAASQTIDHGTNATSVTALPDKGHHFVQWSDGSNANPRTDTNVTGPIAVTAGFAINQYTLTYTSGAHGTLSGTSPQTVTYGASGSAVTAVPDAGYLFVKWSDGSTANPRTDTNVVANLAVSASFAEVPYVVTGFFAPVDMPQANVVVWNSAHAGQTVPVKWRLTKNGVPVSDPGSFLSDPGGLFSSPVNCSNGDGSVDVAIEEYAPGNSSLAYKGDGYWQFNWQTLTAYKSSCRVMFVRFRDGTISATANFKFK